MKEYFLREWRPSDAAEIASVEAECFRAPWSEEALCAEAQKSFSFGVVAVGEKGVAGYASGSAIFEDGEVFRVAVTKECRGQGLGGRIFDLLLARLKERGAAHVFLEVRVSNAVAIRLYESRGFAIVRKRERYYPDGEDAFEMKKVF